MIGPLLSLYHGMRRAPRPSLAALQQVRGARLCLDPGVSRAPRRVLAVTVVLAHGFDWIPAWAGRQGKR